MNRFFMPFALLLLLAQPLFTPLLASTSSTETDDSPAIAAQIAQFLQAKTADSREALFRKLAANKGIPLSRLLSLLDEEFDPALKWHALTGAASVSIAYDRWKISQESDEKEIAEAMELYRDPKSTLGTNAVNTLGGALRLASVQRVPATQGIEQAFFDRCFSTDDPAIRAQTLRYLPSRQKPGLILRAAARFINEDELRKNTPGIDLILCELLKQQWLMVPEKRAEILDLLRRGRPMVRGRIPAQTWDRILRHIQKNERPPLR